ncbi:hypothetical protein KIW84_034155 [Lathyrus oleraceus]|uniref:Uncharacterized protein n=1 Tax=Pisum sativum TaxID=3888 RepID=A0A9D5B453_PEA|nr:hypothetical protein KIW84_034155 [Pisum sativum]
MIRALGKQCQRHKREHLQKKERGKISNSRGSQLSLPYNSNTQWGSGVQITSTPNVDPRIHYDPYGVVLSCKSVEESSIKKLRANIQKLADARTFHISMRKLLGVKTDIFFEGIGQERIKESITRGQPTEQIRNSATIIANGVFCRSKMVNLENKAGHSVEAVTPSAPLTSNSLISSSNQLENANGYSGNIVGSANSKEPAVEPEKNESDLVTEQTEATL